MLLVTVVKTWGSSPRPEGAMLAVREDGLVVGSVSGGCIEDDIVDRTRREGQRATKCEVVTYGVSADEARRFGLPCGGTIQLVLEPLTRESGMRALLREVETGHLVARRLDLASGFATLHPAQPNDGLAFDGKMLRTIHGPRYRMLVIGASQLVEVSRADRRRPRLRGDDLRSARGIHGDLGRAGRDARAHDARRHRAGDAARRALRGRRAHARPEARRPRADGGAQVARVLRRRDRLAREQREAPRAAARVRSDDAQIARLHGPIGLYIGSRTPPEIAISILAEITAIKNGVDPGHVTSVAAAKAELAKTPACSVLDESASRFRAA